MISLSIRASTAVGLFSGGGGGGANLSWPAVTQDEGGFTISPDGYIVYASQNSEDPQDQGLSQNTGSTSPSYNWSHPSFTAASTWYFWARAYEGGAYSGFLALGPITF